MFIKLILQFICLLFSLQGFAILNANKEANWLKSSVGVLLFDSHENIGFDSLSKTSRCTGVLISERYVLTAAHCVKDLMMDRAYQLDLSAVRILLSNKKNVRQLLRIKNASVFVEFLFLPGMDMDVGVLELESSLDGKEVVISELASVNEVKELLKSKQLNRQRFLANGVGHNSLGPIAIESYLEQATYIDSVHLDKNRAVLRATDQKSMLYFGDSGGPLYSFIDGKWKLVALFSHVGGKYSLGLENGIKFIPKTVSVRSLTGIFSIVSFNQCWISLNIDSAELAMNDEECHSIQDVVLGDSE